VTDLVYTDAAEQDLTEIALWIAADNPRAAFRFVNAIREHCALLKAVSSMGRPRRDIRSDIRSFPHGSYIVYYRRREDIDQVDILRIWAWSATNADHRRFVVSSSGPETLTLRHVVLTVRRIEELYDDR
jgi:toxin ParE1/3/4